MQLQLIEFRESPATHIVSLGPRCATAYNLRRYFNFAGAFPFDWWITGGDGVAAFLEKPDIERLYDPTLLEPTRGATSIRHSEFGFLLHHEFPRQWHLPGLPVQENWRDFLEQPKQRTAALLDKLLRLNATNNRIAFIREGLPCGKLATHLDILFASPVWTLVELRTVEDANDVHGWKGDPAAWDQILDGLGLTLDLTGHRLFDAAKVEPETESKAAQPI